MGYLRGAFVFKRSPSARGTNASHLLHTISTRLPRQLLESHFTYELSECEPRMHARERWSGERLALLKTLNYLTSLQC
jgi:hypothetical protein